MTDEPDEPIGYKKPPRHSRFKPGQSGNPSGKRNGSRSLRDDLRDELRETVRVTENGKVRQLSKQQLVVKALTTKAAKGETAAIAKLIDLVLQLFGIGDDGDAQGKALSVDDDAVIAAALARKRFPDGDGSDG